MQGLMRLVRWELWERLMMSCEVSKVREDDEQDKVGELEEVSGVIQIDE